MNTFVFQPPPFQAMSGGHLHERDKLLVQGLVLLVLVVRVLLLALLRLTNFCFCCVNVRARRHRDGIETWKKKQAEKKKSERQISNVQSCVRAAGGFLLCNTPPHMHTYTHSSVRFPPWRPPLANLERRPTD